MRNEENIPSRYMFSEFIECFEENIQRQIDCKRPSSILHHI